MSNTKKFQFNWNDIKGKIKKEEEDKQSFGDQRFWKLSLKDKKGTAIIRFLPDPNGTPHRQYFSHYFEYETPSGGTQFYIGNCPTSIKQPCPICNKNKELWNSSYKVDEDEARKRKRKNHFVSNILVVKDEVQPDTEDKIWLFDHGPQVHNIYMKRFIGPEEDDADYGDDNFVTFPPSDLYEGANFLLRSTIKKGTENSKNPWNEYVSSRFYDQSRIFDELDDIAFDEKLDAIMEQVFDLDEWMKPNKYPTESDVRAKLGYILGSTSANKTEPSPEYKEDEIPFESESVAVTDNEEDSGSSHIEQSDQEYLDSVLDKN